jgi:hypothetical protein
MIGGEGEIRTPERRLTATRFRVVRLQPLGHLSTLLERATGFANSARPVKLLKAGTEEDELRTPSYSLRARDRREDHCGKTSFASLHTQTRRQALE